MKPLTSLPFYRLDLGIKVSPGPQSEMLRPLSSGRQKQADPRLFTALINKLPTHKSSSCNWYLRMLCPSLASPNGPLKVAATLSGWELHTECTSWSGARGVLETHFCYVYWQHWRSVEGFQWRCKISFNLEAGVICGCIVQTSSSRGFGGMITIIWISRQQLGWSFKTIQCFIYCIYWP